MCQQLDRSFRGPRGRRISGSIERTAPLLPGSSGGPIVDESGKLLGTNTNRLGEGFYLAIAADDQLRNRVNELTEGERHSAVISAFRWFPALSLTRCAGPWASRTPRGPGT